MQHTCVQVQKCDNKGANRYQRPLPFMSLRKRIEKSQFLATFFAACAGSYLAFCNRTTRWQTNGLDDLQKALNEGPVLLVMWHSRSVMGALHWPVKMGPLSSLYDRSPIGRISGALQRRVGLQPIEMSRKKSNRAASRIVLQRVKDGVSIGMTGDGPLGPPREIKDAPLDWARVTGMPVFCYAFSTTRGRRLASWDQMLIPHPFGKGAFVYRRLDVQIPRKASQDELEVSRAEIKTWMDQTTGEADAMLGLSSGP